MLYTHGLIPGYLSSFQREFSVFVLVKVQTLKGITTSSQSALFPSQVLLRKNSIKTELLIRLAVN